MLFFADVSIFARPPFKTRRSHLNDISFFFGLAVFWLHFETLKGQPETLETQSRALKMRILT